MAVSRADGWWHFALLLLPAAMFLLNILIITEKQGVLLRKETLTA